MKDSIPHFMGIISGNSRVCRMGSFKDFDYSYKLNKIQNFVPASSGVLTGIGDALCLVNVASYLQDKYTVDIIKNPCNRIDSDIIIGSNNTSVLTDPDISGVLSCINTGPANIFLQDKWGNINYISTYSKGINNNINISTGIGSVTGSLLNHSITSVDSLIVSNKDLNLFSVKDNTNNHFEYNINNVFSMMDFSCASVWNSNGGYGKCGILISPIHIIMAAHYYIPAGSSVRFVGKDNVICERTVVATVDYPDHNYLNCDITIGVLNAPVDDNIKVCQLFPQNFSEYITSYRGNIGYKFFPLICFNQFRETFVLDLALLQQFTFSTKLSIFPNRVSYTKNAIVGDSSCPIFSVINGELVLFSYWSIVGGDTVLSSRLDGINILSKQLNSDYNINVADLSLFPKY